MKIKENNINVYQNTSEGREMGGGYGVVLEPILILFFRAHNTVEQKVRT